MAILGQRMILAHASSFTHASNSIIEALPILGLTLNHHRRTGLSQIELDKFLHC